MLGAHPMPCREYRRSDFESMLALDRECFPPGIAYSRSELRAFLSLKTAETIVVEREGRIVAFVLGWRRGSEGHVITLDVAAPARRQGLGRQLLAELEGRFRAAGARRVQLETAVTNTIAIAFYERLGYRKVARLRGYYGPGLHAWTMEKALDGGEGGRRPRAVRAGRRPDRISRNAPGRRHPPRRRA
jgi:ribosomal-protein-alanine N-acetyltransferase